VNSSPPHARVANVPEIVVMVIKIEVVLVVIVILVPAAARPVVVIALAMVPLEVRDELLERFSLFLLDHTAVDA